MVHLRVLVNIDFPYYGVKPKSVRPFVWLQAAVKVIQAKIATKFGKISRIILSIFFCMFCGFFVMFLSDEDANYFLSYQDSLNNNRVKGVFKNSFIKKDPYLSARSYILYCYLPVNLIEQISKDNYYILNLKQIFTQRKKCITNIECRISKQKFSTFFFMQNKDKSKFLQNT